KYVENLLELLFLLADHTVNNTFEIKDNPFNNEILNRNTFNILKQGWNTIIDKDYLIKLEQNLHIPFKDFKLETYSYNIINYIYKFLQKKYIVNGKGIGIYSKYLINRNSELRNLKNINYLSWNCAFQLLVWNPQPKTDLRIIIEELYKLSANQRDFYNNLIKVLGQEYKDDIKDIIFCVYPLLNYKPD
ncbi:unnamed protein product, partial [marine sediment metagenome]